MVAVEVLVCCQGVSGCFLFALVSLPLVLSFLLSISMSFDGSTTNLLSSHQSPDAMTTILEKDDIEWIQGVCEILEEITLEVPDLFGKATSTQENWRALYEEAQKVD